MKQVFRLSLAVVALILICGVSAFAQGPTLTQLTASPADSFATDISGDGRYIVIESRGDIGSKIAGLNSDNTDGNLEIFIYDIDQGFVFQITHTKSALRNTSGSPTDRANILVEISNNKPVISHDGRWIAFGSNAATPGNFDGNGHPELSSDANSEIFLYQIPTTPQNLTTGTFRRITDTPASRPPQGGTSTTSPVFADDNRSAAINDNGTLVAFVSTRDILPGHNAESSPNPEIFIFNRSTNSFSQVTETEGMFIFNENPSLSGPPPPSNTVIAFISNANLTQNNGDGNAEVYVANFNGATTTSINQVTRTAVPSNSNPIVNVFSPGRRLSRNGNLIAFESTANLAGDGTIQPTFAIFSYNVGSNTFTQVGQRAAAGSDVALRFPTYTGDSSRLVFGSALNFNADGTIATSGGLNFNRAVNIFSTPVPGPGTPVSLTQLTRIPLIGSPGGGQPSLQAYPADTHDRVAFTVRLNLNAGNPDNSVEAYYVRQASTAPATMHTIGGQVKVGTSGQALDGATVTITSSSSGFAPRTAQTNSTGNYSFTDLPAGNTYTVKSAKTNYTFTPTQKSFTSLDANQTADFTATAAAPRTYSITGRVMNISGKGIQGVTVKLSGSRTLTTTTNSQGGYSFTGLPAGGNYTVKPVLAGTSFDPLSKSFNNLSANQTTTAASFLVVYTIRGRVVRAGTTTGIGGVTVKLSGPRGTTTTTDSNGNYKFDKLPAGGNYSIQPTKSGMSFSPGVQKFPLLDSNFRAALDLASNAFTMASAENRKASAMHAINRLMEAKHYYTGETDIHLGTKAAVVDAYLATVSLSYVAEARCYLELEELDTARQLLDAGASYLDARIRYYVHVLLTTNPSAYLHPSLKGKVDLQRLTKIFQWFRPELDERAVFEEQRENIFNLSQNQEKWIQTLPPAIWDNTIVAPEKSTFFSKFDALDLFGGQRPPDRNAKVYERLSSAIEVIEAMIEDMRRFHAYRMEVQAIQKLNVSFSQWQQLAPPADSPDDQSGLMMITLPQPLMLTA